MRPPQQSDVFNAIAHPARRAILTSLRNGERAVGEIAEPFPMTFAAISQHLHILEAAELVTVRRSGRNRFYRLRPDPLKDVADWTEQFAAFFALRLDALGDYLDRKHSRR
jgi:DNA-binding transcriptional ArsR family regulator